MEFIWIIPLALVFGLELGAIAAVIHEDVLYDSNEKFFKIIFIIFVPIIGAIIELRKLDRYARYTTDDNGNDVMVYAFWDYYTTSHLSDNNSGSDGGGDSD